MIIWKCQCQNEHRILKGAEYACAFCGDVYKSASVPVTTEAPVPSGLATLSVVTAAAPTSDTPLAVLTTEQAPDATIESSVADAAAGGTN